MYSGLSKQQLTVQHVVQNCRKHESVLTAVLSNWRLDRKQFLAILLWYMAGLCLGFGLPSVNFPTTLQTPTSSTGNVQQAISVTTMFVRIAKILNWVLNIWSCLKCKYNVSVGPVQLKKKAYLNNLKQRCIAAHNWTFGQLRGLQVQWNPNN